MSLPSPPTHIRANPNRQYKYYEFVMAAFVAVYLCSNLIGPAKAAALDLPFFGMVTFGAGVVPVCTTN